MEERGKGFVHLNTPASIKYTEGQVLSISELKRPKSRVEAVTVPHYMKIWRKAFTQYMQIENYTKFADDMEDERSGMGPLLPSIASVNKAVTESFFFTPSVANNASEPASQITHNISNVRDTKEINTSDNNNVIASAAVMNNGISIVSHHKVAGLSEFVYPDYDGILSSGVIPEVVVTAEEQAELDADKRFYISPLEMTNDELNAFEELQSMWKNKARSHSYAGAQHRAASASIILNANGEAVSLKRKERYANMENDNEGDSDDNNTRLRKRARTTDSNNNNKNDNVDNNNSIQQSRSAWHKQRQEYVPEQHYDDVEQVEENSDELLEEALRMADDLLRYA